VSKTFNYNQPICSTIVTINNLVALWWQQPIVLEPRKSKVIEIRIGIYILSKIFIMTLKWTKCIWAKISMVNNNFSKSIQKAAEVMSTLNTCKSLKYCLELLKKKPLTQMILLFQLQHRKWLKIIVLIKCHKNSIMML